MKKRLNPTLRRRMVLEDAIQTAEQIDYNRLTYDNVAADRGYSKSLVQWHFRSVSELRLAVLKEGIATSNLTIIAQGVVAMNQWALQLTPEVKKRALDYVLANSERGAK